MAITSVRALLSLALVATAGSAAPARATTASRTPALRWTAQGCVESVLSVAIPIEVAQRQLPSPYRARPVGEGGQGSLYIGVTQCRALQVGGVEQSSDVLSDVGIAIHPVPGLPSATYHLWQVVGSDGLRKRVARLGLPGATVPGTTASVTRTPAAQLATGDVPWDGGSDYTVDVAGARPVVSPGGTATFVHQGARGRVRTVYRFGEHVAHNGAGTVRTSPGTRLAALMGGEAKPTTRPAGYVYEPFDISASVYLDR